MVWYGGGDGPCVLKPLTPHLISCCLVRRPTSLSIYTLQAVLNSYYLCHLLSHTQTHKRNILHSISSGTTCFKATTLRRWEQPLSPTRSRASTTNLA